MKDVYKWMDDSTVYSTRVKLNILKIVCEYNSSNILSSTQTLRFKWSIFYSNVSLKFIF